MFSIVYTLPGVRGKRISPATVVQTITIGKNKHKYDKTIKNASSPISLYPHIWRIWFQLHTIRPTCNTSSNSYSFNQ